MPAETNPLLAEWETPFGIAPYDQIAPEHFGPAFDRAIEDHRNEIETIAALDTPPDLENTLNALEKAGRLLRRISAVFFNLSGAHTNDLLQEIERDMAPKLAQHRNTILLNRALFLRIETLMKRQKELGLSAEQARVLERYHTMFLRAGAQLQGQDRERIAEISERLAVLGTRFSQNILADEKAYELILEEGPDLAGLPDFFCAAAARTAEDRGHKGKYAITLSRSSIEPFLRFSSRRDLREQAYKAWTSRGELGGDTDNREIVRETIALRCERARLLGFETFAAYKLDDQMAKTPMAVRKLLTQVWQPARAQALIERDELQDLAREEGSNITIAPWDWRYYADRLRQKSHDVGEQEVKPYFQLNKMIEAAFDTAHQLFGLNFRELKDLPLYHPDARVFEVTNETGGHVGLFLGDYFARGSKRSGAWMSALRQQEKLDDTIAPIIVNVMNFAKSGDDDTNLLTFDDARTLFHEFGHGLHGLLSDVTYPIISGTSVARDFVELPSQLYEHWLSAPEVLRKYAVHYRTGEPIPEELLERLLAAEQINQGFATVEYVASALVDLEIHLLKTADGLDVQQFEHDILQSIDMPPEILMRHRVPHFAHAFAGDGYSAGYYSYLWSEVMDADAFAAFREAGDIYDKDTADKLFKHIYAAGGREKPENAYVAFRGRMPTIDALLDKRGLTPEPQTGA